MWKAINNRKRLKKAVAAKWCPAESRVSQQAKNVKKKHGIWSSGTQKPNTKLALAVHRVDTILSISSFKDKQTCKCELHSNIFYKQYSEQKVCGRKCKWRCYLSWSYLAFITVSSWFPRFKYTPPGNTKRQDSNSNNTSRLFLPRSTKSPLKTYGFSGDGKPFCCKKKPTNEHEWKKMDQMND